MRFLTWVADNNQYAVREKDTDNENSGNGRQLGIRFSPPALVLIYPLEGKLRRRIMPIRHFQKTSNVTFAAAGIRARHETQLKDVPSVAIEKMLRLLQENLKGASLDEALLRVEKEFGKGVDDKIETGLESDNQDENDDEFWLLHTAGSSSLLGSSVKWAYVVLNWDPSSAELLSLVRSTDSQSTNPLFALKSRFIWPSEDESRLECENKGWPTIDSRLPNFERQKPR